MAAKAQKDNNRGGLRLLSKKQEELENYLKDLQKH
jgi:hypothetical protein